MAGAQWTRFPFDQKPYTHSGAALKKAWPRFLHIRMKEPVT